MKVIWKAPVTGHRVEILMPVDAVVLTVMVQEDIPTIWFQGDDGVQKARRRVWIVGTGVVGELEGITGSYVGSFILGWFVGHVYADGPLIGPQS